MEIQITSRHEKASQSLQDTLTAELEGLQRFYDRITSCHVVLDKERGKEIMEIVVHMAGHTVAGNAKAENLGKAIDLAITKVERQLKKINEKIKSHKGAGPKKTRKKNKYENVKQPQREETFRSVRSRYIESSRNGKSTIRATDEKRILHKGSSNYSFFK